MLLNFHVSFNYVYKRNATFIILLCFTREKGVSLPIICLHNTYLSISLKKDNITLKATLLTYEIDHYFIFILFHLSVIKFLIFHYSSSKSMFLTFFSLFCIILHPKPVRIRLFLYGFLYFSSHTT